MNEISLRQEIRLSLSKELTDHVIGHFEKNMNISRKVLIDFVEQNEIKEQDYDAIEDFYLEWVK